MGLASVGAVFVLGKLEAEISLNASNAPANVGMRTNSPGVALAVLGTALMIVGLFADRPVEVTDEPTQLLVSEDYKTPGDDSPSDLTAKYEALNQEYKDLKAKFESVIQTLDVTKKASDDENSDTGTQ